MKTVVYLNFALTLMLIIATFANWVRTDVVADATLKFADYLVDVAKVQQQR